MSIKRLIISDKVWVLITQYDRDHNVVDMVSKFKEFIPDGRMMWIGSNKAFCRPAKFHDFQHIVKHLYDGKGEDYLTLLYYKYGNTTKLKKILHFVRKMMTWSVLKRNC